MSAHRREPQRVPYVGAVRSGTVSLDSSVFGSCGMDGYDLKTAKALGVTVLQEQSFDGAIDRKRSEAARREIQAIAFSTADI